MIQAAIGQAVDSINAGQSVVTFAAAFAGLILGLGALSGILAAAANLLYANIEAGTLSDYSTARSSSTLKSELICAIYSAIAADGAVTTANFPNVLLAVSAIAYTPSAVVTTIHDYLAALTDVGLMQVQAVGAVAVYDCSSCSGAPVGAAVKWANTTAFSGISLGPGHVDTGSNVTFGGWVDDLASNGHSQYMLNAGTGSPGFNHGQSLVVLSDGRVAAFFNNGTTTALAATSGALAAGKHHVACTYDGATLKLYVDGALAASVAHTGTTWRDTNPSPAFGTSSAGLSVERSIFKLWRWAWYAGTLTAAQIAAWYASGSFVPPPAGYQHRWDMTEGAGTTVADSGGTATGTLAGSVSWNTHT